ncbi:E3 ubiquitin-protein ligase RNF14-like isoform X3 [Carassius gibelio]|nr:E3 ubiquitin-protein ligase RNF14-like isoform X3 [Carassius gibelio]XP_052443948.1 E3 ubiquitin-protein ligase RNF14-like isoform X3 [Carassius gibelio]XP_052443949.1 E3 ubiquitin-protein ligase RNF14-like isoform X3 [Carassius gibelio]XP_052443950.1 E3 ubiquitin-protein ligase RNF14-like isoform X3 [Carassius gibelio]
MSTDQEAQEDELLALASIYDEKEFRRAESAKEGEIHLCLELPPNFTLLVKGHTSTEHRLSFLCPLVLSFRFPANYPSASAPLFVLSSNWLTRVQITALCRRLDELWEENQGNVILFTWMQFLKEETLDFLGIQSPLEIQSIESESGLKQAADVSGEKCKVQDLDPRAVQEVDARTDILSQLLDFDEAQNQKVFDGTVFCCSICFLDKLGSESLLFKECQHVYCKSCMKEYFQIQIRDGKVQCLTCPDPKCVSMATPSQVKLLVSKDEFARYDRLLLQSSLDLMKDVVYCPRISCSMAVMVEPDSNMGICPACKYPFCTLCKRTYHGLNNCIPTDDDLRMQDEDNSASEEWNKIEERHAIQRVLDSLCTDWVKVNCKQCPCCGTNIEKNMGCNKMTCSVCHGYFCWICLTALCKKDPYSHYKDPDSPCYNQ